MKQFFLLAFGVILGLLLFGSDMNVFASGTPVATNVIITGIPDVGKIFT